jgi:putative hydrolase of the HAD superfamily
MSSFISEKFNVDLVKAKEIQKKYFYEYGTNTLRSYEP